MPEWVVILTALPPPVPTVKISMPPKRSETNAIVLESLDHTGCDSNEADEVRRTASPPDTGT